ncbi:MAG: IS66 family transposase [Desulfobacterales bacterium]|nr:IS66 family transposase [Desulfobacterales bacterium]
MSRPKQLDLKAEDLEGLLARVEKGILLEGDYQIIKSLVEAIALLSQSLDDKATAIKRLLRMIFGAKTETMEKVFQNKSKLEAISKQQEAEQKKGHGRNGAAAYTKAERIKVAHETLKSGASCPECKGKVYPVKKSGIAVRFMGMAPLAAKIYDLEKLRCNLCGEVFTAETPAGVGPDKYDETAGSMVAVLKYGSGVPFYRIEKLQESLGVPLPASTQWDIVEQASNRGVYPAYRELVREAAQGDVIHNDDTPMKILALMKNSEEKAARTGMFTTGMVSIVEDHRIALFFTGQKHAGENMLELLKQRDAKLNPPIQMCDALSRNAPEALKIILANCLTHGRRNFVDVAGSFPEETSHVIDQIAQVYRNDQTAKDQHMSPQERLLFHQQESGPVMKNLKEWLSEQLDQKKAEPNSGLGKAIAYMLKHWEPLTLFLRVPGAPLDNNICEQALKKAILNRKNALFYRTEHGAFVGDMFMSLIHTCNLGHVNPFDYLTALQKHASEVSKNPSNWMPWNYQNSMPVDDS